MIITAAFFLHPAVFAEDGVPAIERLLAGYLENDAALRELAVKTRQAELARERAGIKQGFDFNLSTGNTRLSFENGGTELSVAPKAELSLPALNGTSLIFSTPMVVEGGGSGSGFALENAQLSLSTNITSKYRKQREITLLKADRALLEARRALNERALLAEKTFFETLRSLYDAEIQALSNEENAYTKEIELAVAVSQGHPPSSVKYRTLKLEAEDALRAAEEERRLLARKIAGFSRDCGLEFNVMPQYKAQSVEGNALESEADFGQDEQKPRFSAVESAKWRAFLGKLERDAAGDLEIKAQGGFTAWNTNFDKQLSADAGITLDWKGMIFALGTQVPIYGEEKYPAFSLSLGFQAGKHRAAALTGEEKRLAAETESLAVMNASRAWEDAVDTVRDERDGLIWEKQRLAQQHTLYAELLRDTQALYNQGYISESEYGKTVANEKRAKYRLLAVEVKIRVHLINSALYFVEE
jgi:hypothetical protein